MTELEKLIRLLEVSGIPHEVCPHWDNTMIVCYPVYGDGRICDAVCFPGSYGYSDGLLEMWGLVSNEEDGDDVEGWLDANTVFSRILNHYLDYYTKGRQG